MVDGLVKSRNPLFSVIPVKPVLAGFGRGTGIQEYQTGLDSRLRGSDPFGDFLPQTFVEAMLSAIGMIIIIKQLPLFLGITAPPRKTIVESLSVLPGQAECLQAEVFLIGALSLALMFALNRIKKRWFKIIPPALSVSVVGPISIIQSRRMRHPTMSHMPTCLPATYRQSP